MISHPTQRTLGWMLLYFVIFLLVWYDATHQHILTDQVNGFIQHMIRVPFPVEHPSEARGLYHHLLFVISWFGGNVMFAIAMGALSIFLLLKKQYKLFGIVLLTAVLGIGIAHLFKFTVHSPRPVPFDVSYDSFPSGHVTRVVLWCGLWLLVAKKARLRLPHIVASFLALLPIVVAFSRLALGRHWLGDVVGAWVLMHLLLLGASLVLIHRHRKQG